MSSSLLRRAWRPAWRGLWALAFVTLAGPVHAVSITGVMVYSTDDFGNPNGYESFASDKFQAQMWRTLSRPGLEWYGLGVASGLPPKSVDAPFLNFPDFSVDLPLDEGENYFTLFAEPGPLTATDEYQRFMVNLYFDGDMETPGIAVLFPRYSEPDGSTVAEARPNEGLWYGFQVQKISGTPPTYYDDGIYRVSVLRASLLPPERANMSVDRLTSHTLGSGASDADWIGALVLSVEPSESFGPGGGVPGPLGSSGSAGGSRGGSGGGVPAGGGSAGYIPPGAYGQPAAGQDQGGFDGYDDAAGSAKGGTDDFWHKGDAATDTEEEGSDADETPTPADLVGALEQWLRDSADATPSPDSADDENDDGTPGPDPTRSADSTAVAETATPGATAATPTPGSPTPAPSGSPEPTSTPPAAPAQSPGAKLP